MMARNCESLLMLVRRRLQEDLQLRPINQETCILTTPFYDNSGDPIKVAVSQRQGAITIDDAGAIAGHLFSLGQHTVDTPAFKLLQALADTYSLRLDFDEGLVELTVSENDLVDGIMDLAKVILTMVTATQHMRVFPRRLRLFGARVRTKIRKEYETNRILELVQPYYEIRGSTVDAWPIDFHWFVTTGELARDVYIVAVDLDVSEPIRKAERVAALAIDAKSQVERNYLRIVMDKHGHNSQSDVAAAFLKEHSKELRYEAFDFGVEEHKNRFVNQSINELLGAAGARWREFWLKGQG